MFGIIKEEIFFFFHGFCGFFFFLFFPSFNQRAVCSRDNVWQDRFKNYYTLQGSLFSWRALMTPSLWGHVSYYIASTFYYLWKFLTYCRWSEPDLKCYLVIVEYRYVWKRKLIQWHTLAQVHLQYESDIPFSLFLLAVKYMFNHNLCKEVKELVAPNSAQIRTWDQNFKVKEAALSCLRERKWFFLPLMGLSYILLLFSLVLLRRSELTKQMPYVFYRYQTAVKIKSFTFEFVSVSSVSFKALEIAQDQNRFYVQFFAHEFP